MVHQSKRRSERVFANVEVLFAVEGECVEGTVTDVNAHGLFVCTQRPLDRGQVVFFELALPDRRPLRFYGMVRFKGENPAGSGMGVELLSLSIDEQSRWLDFYASLCPPSVVEARQVA